MKQLKRVYKTWCGDIEFNAFLIKTEIGYIVRFNNDIVFGNEAYCLDSEIGFYDKMGVVLTTGTIRDLFEIDEAMR